MKTSPRNDQPGDGDSHESQELATPPAVVPGPIVEQDLADLLRLILVDIQEWSRERGHGAVPPYVFLRQVANYAEAIRAVRSADPDNA